MSTFCRCPPITYSFVAVLIVRSGVSNRSTLIAAGRLRSFPQASTARRCSTAAHLVPETTMMVPFQVTLFPQYALYLKLGWVTTYLPLMVPPFLGVGGALFIFLMRQFFLSIPNELGEAAVIDGCSTIGVFWRIMLPLARTAMVTVVIFQFVFTWNDFFGPLIYLTNSTMFTLPLGIATFQSAYGTDVGPLLALSLLAVIPILILFFVGQKTFVQGIAATGHKGQSHRELTSP